jgi:DNA-binding CsgD family transcriptional regulator
MGRSTAGRGSDASDLVERGRAFAAERAWSDARDALARADEQTPLGIDDLELFALSSGLAGDDAAMLRTQERLHHAHLGAGRAREAARSAFWIAYRLLSLGEAGRAQGWLARAERIVDGLGEDCVERGFLILPAVQRHLRAGDLGRAEALALAACETGERFGDRDLIALSRILLGCAMTKQGRVEGGLSLLDDAMLAATSNELSPVVAGIVYCTVISTCSQVYALERAREWTVALTHWCDAQPQLVPFAGACLVHRAELMELGGDWDDSIEEARRATERLSLATDPTASADAVYQQAEIHRLRGEFEQAEEAYARARSHGREPLPGLALLRLWQGRCDAAAGSMRRVVASTTDPLRRSRYLPAHVEIMLAAGDLEAARDAAAELEKLAAGFGTDVLGAIAAQARALVLLAGGDAQASVAPLRSALLVWRRVRAPYLAARVHVLLGRACAVLGDPDGARLEWNAAREDFLQLGARPDLAVLDAVSAPPAPPAPQPARKNPDRLSARELQVLRLIAAGRTNRAMAAELFLSEKTVDRHVSNIFVKIQVGSRAAATAYAYEHELIGEARVEPGE